MLQSIMRLLPTSIVIRTIILSVLGIGVLTALAAGIWISTQVNPPEQLALYLRSDDTRLLLSTPSRAVLDTWLKPFDQILAGSRLPYGSDIPEGNVYDFAIIRSQSGGLSGWALGVRTMNAQTQETSMKIITSDPRISTLLKQTRDAGKNNLISAPLFQTSTMPDRALRLFVHTDMLDDIASTPGDLLLGALLSPYEAILLERDGNAGSIRLERKETISSRVPATLGDKLSLPLPSSFSMEMSEPARFLAAVTSTVRDSNAPLADGLTGIIRQWWQDHFSVTDMSAMSALLSKPAMINIQGGSGSAFLLSGETDGSAAADQLMQTFLTGNGKAFTIRNQQFSPQFGRTDIRAQDAQGNTFNKNGWSVTDASTNGGMAIARRGYAYLFSSSGAVIERIISGTVSQESMSGAIVDRSAIARGSLDPAFAIDSLTKLMPFLSPVSGFITLTRSTFLPDRPFEWSWVEDSGISTIRWNNKIDISN